MKTRFLAGLAIAVLALSTIACGTSLEDPIEGGDDGGNGADAPTGSNSNEAGGSTTADDGGSPTAIDAGAEASGDRADAADGAEPQSGDDGGAIDGTIDASPSNDGGLDTDTGTGTSGGNDAGGSIDGASNADASIDDAASPDASEPGDDGSDSFDAAGPDASDSGGPIIVVIDAGPPIVDAGPPLVDAGSCVIPASAWTSSVAVPALPPESPPVVDSTIDVALSANGLLYDPYTKLLYASVPSSFGANGNSIARIDPTSGAVLGFVYVGSEPSALAESADGQFLYVGLNGASAVRRYVLATQTPDTQFSIEDPPYYSGFPTITAIQVLPESPHSVLVSTSDYYVGLYDDGVLRGAPVYASASGVLATGSDSLAFAPVYYSQTDVLCIDDAGPHVAQTETGATANYYGGPWAWEPGQIYSSGGQVLDVVNDTLVGTYGSSGPFAVEPRVDRVYFLGSSYVYPAGQYEVTIQSYTQDHFTPAGSIGLLGNTSYSSAGGLIRWGRYGFAFIVSTSQIAIVRTSLVPAGP